MGRASAVDVEDGVEKRAMFTKLDRINPSGFLPS